MKRPYSDHTAELAIGSADKEWKAMARIAVRIRERNCTPEYAEENEPRFIGIFSRLLTDPIEQVKREAGR